MTQHTREQGADRLSPGGGSFRLANPAVLAAVLALASGCAARDHAGQAGDGPLQAVSYTCSASDREVAPTKTRGRLAPQAPHPLSIIYDSQQRPVVLIFGNSERYGLKKVPGTAGLFSASSSYAWRADGSGGYITDVGNALLFRCQRVDANPAGRS